MPRRSNCVARMVFICGLLWLATADLMAQQTPATSSTLDLRDQDKAAAEVTAEQVTAGKFFAVLLQRPRLGTALDRVYAHHLQAATLDEFLTQQIRLAQSGDQAGSRYLVIGLIERLRGNDAVAAEMIGQAESIRTDDAMASFYLGQALLAQGKTSDAATALQRAIEREPARVDALPVFKELARILVRQQKTDEALAVWTKLEGRFPDDSRVAEQIAAALADDDQLEPALARYEQLVKAMGSQLDDRTIGFGIQVAELKRRLGRDDEALRDFESLLARLRPSSWLYNDIRGRVEAMFIRDGDYAALADYYSGQVTQHPDDIELQLRWCFALSESGRTSEAEAALLRATERAPQNVQARLALVSVLVRLERIPEAAEQLQVLVNQDSANPDYLVRLGELWLEDAKQTLDARRDKAAAVWNQLARARDDDPVITAQVAELMRRIEHTDEALKLFRRAIGLAPERAEYREYLGEYLSKLGREGEALVVWHAIAAPPRDSRENLVRLAEVLIAFEHADESLEVFGRLMDFDPTPDERLRYATLLRNAQRFDDAFAQLDRAESIKLTADEREQVWTIRIELYTETGTLNAKIVEAQEVCRSKPHAESYRRLAMLWRAASRPHEAMIAVRSAMKVDPDDVPTLTLAAELHRDTRMFSDAVRLYRQLIELKPQLANTYRRQISTAQISMGDSPAALATIREMIAAQPANTENYRLYAEQCFRTEQPKEGIATLRRALAFAPRDPELLRDLADQLALQNRTNDAIELRWQLLDDATQIAVQIQHVSELALLYQRTGDFDFLVNRLQSRERDASTRRQAKLLEAAARRQVKDFGTALTILSALVINHPSDAELLRELVQVCKMANKKSEAIQYQHQLTIVDDTPENRSQLLELLAESDSPQDIEQLAFDGLNREEMRKTAMTMLSRIAPGGERQTAKSNSIASRCLSLAKACARATLWDVAMESIRRGFAGGPPFNDPMTRMSSLGLNVNTLYGPRVSTRSPSQTSRAPGTGEKEVDAYATQLNSLFQRIDDAATTLSPEDYLATYRTLVEVVLPKSQPGDVLPYFSRPTVAVGSQSTTHVTLDQASPSLARYLAIAAARSGQSDALIQRLDHRTQDNPTPPLIYIRLQLALAMNQRESYTAALQELADELIVYADSTKQRMLTNTLGDVDTAMLLFSTLDVHHRDGRSPLVTDIEAFLVKLSTTSYEMSSHEPYLAWMTSDAIASQGVSTEQVLQIVDDRLVGLKHQFSSVGTEGLASELKNEVARLIPIAVAADRFEVVGNILRFSSRESDSLEKNLVFWKPPELTFLGLDPELRYRCWSHVVLGHQPSDKLMLMPNVLQSAEVPKDLQSVVPNFAIMQQLPIASEHFPLHSAALVLIEAAVQTNHIDELLARLRERIVHPGDEADSLVGLTLLAANRTDEVEQVMDRVFVWLLIGTNDKGLAVPMPAGAMMLAIRAGEVKSLRTKAARLWPLLRQHAERRWDMMTLSLIDRMLMQVSHSENAKVESQSPYEHWIATASTSSEIPSWTPPMYSADESKLRVSSSWHNEVLLVKYPLAGDFALTHVRPAKSPESTTRMGNGHSLFAATVYQVPDYGAFSLVLGMSGRGSRRLEAGSLRTDLRHKLSLVVSHDVLMMMNDLEFTRDVRTSSMPFVGFYFDRFLPGEVTDIQISGNPTIPRQVDMIGPELRGWASSIFAGELIEPPYSIPSVELSHESETLRQQSSLDQPMDQAWYASASSDPEGSELRSGGELLTTNPGGQRHLHYTRPLLEGESIEYEFFYEPGKMEVHPALGRIAILLRKDGVKLRWLPQTRSLESTDMPPLGEATPSQLVGDGKPNLLERDWNRVRVTLDGDRLRLVVNEREIAKIDVALDRRFGILGEHDRECRVRAMKLTGPWPETVPDDMMQLANPTK